MEKYDRENPKTNLGKSFTDMLKKICFMEMKRTDIRKIRVPPRFLCKANSGERGQEKSQ